MTAKIKEYSLATKQTLVVNEINKSVTREAAEAAIMADAMKDKDDRVQVAITESLKIHDLTSERDFARTEVADARHQWLLARQQL